MISLRVVRGVTSSPTLVACGGISQAAPGTSLPQTSPNVAAALSVFDNALRGRPSQRPEQRRANRRIMFLQCWCLDEMFPEYVKKWNLELGQEKEQ